MIIKPLIGGYVRVGSNPQAVCVPASQCIQYTPITADQCTDPLKEYSLCGSACPISCATRTVPQNECTERCVAGCFCRIPYILENGRDPQNSRSVSLVNKRESFWNLWLGHHQTICAQIEFVDDLIIWNISNVKFCKSR